MAREKIQGIYAIRNTSNGKVYVGRSSDVSARWASHLRLLNAGKHINPHLQGAWSKYGQGVFRFELLEAVSDPLNLPRREGFYCDALQAHDPRSGYNLEIVRTDGSVSSPMKGRKASEETRRKQSEARKGIPLTEAQRRVRRRPHTPEQTLAIANANRGKKRTKETKQKISQSNAGKVRSDGARAKMSESQKSRFSTREGRDKASRSALTYYESLKSAGLPPPCKGRSPNPEQGKAHSEALRKIYADRKEAEIPHPRQGKVHTEETKRKISETKRLRKLQLEVPLCR